MTVQELRKLLWDKSFTDDTPVIVMTPEKDHHLTYKIVEVVYDNTLDAVVIDVQRSS